MFRRYFIRWTHDNIESFIGKKEEITDICTKLEDVDYVLEYGYGSRATAMNKSKSVQNGTVELVEIILWGQFYRGDKFPSVYVCDKMTSIKLVGEIINGKIEQPESDVIWSGKSDNLIMTVDEVLEDSRVSVFRKYWDNQSGKFMMSLNDEYSFDDGEKRKSFETFREAVYELKHNVRSVV